MAEEIGWTGGEQSCHIPFWYSFRYQPSWFHDRWIMLLAFLGLSFYKILWTVYCIYDKGIDNHLNQLFHKCNHRKMKTTINNNRYGNVCLFVSLCFSILKYGNNSNLSSQCLFSIENCWQSVMVYSLQYSKYYPKRLLASNDAQSHICLLFSCFFLWSTLITFLYNITSMYRNLHNTIQLHYGKN